MDDYSRISLLEMIFMDSGCRSLSDLSSLSKDRRNRIASHIERDIRMDDPTLQDYNEALHYMLCVGPKDTKEEARNCLLRGLK